MDGLESQQFRPQTKLTAPSDSNIFGPQWMEPCGHTPHRPSQRFFAEEGLEDVELVTLESEGASLEALNQGLADFAVDPVTPYVLKAINNGMDIFIIGPRRKTHAFFLFGQKGMKSPRDLKGGKINVFTPGDENG